MRRGEGAARLKRLPAATMLALHARTTIQKASTKEKHTHSKPLARNATGRNAKKQAERGRVCRTARKRSAYTHTTHVTTVSPTAVPRETAGWLTRELRQQQKVGNNIVAVCLRKTKKAETAASTGILRRRNERILNASHHLWAATWVSKTSPGPLDEARHPPPPLTDCTRYRIER